jgi:hypothetical protein
MNKPLIFFLGSMTGTLFSCIGFFGYVGYRAHRTPPSWHMQRVDSEGKTTIYLDFRRPTVGEALDGDVSR